MPATNGGARALLGKCRSSTSRRSRTLPGRAWGLRSHMILPTGRKYSIGMAGADLSPSMSPTHGCQLHWPNPWYVARRRSTEVRLGAMSVQASSTEVRRPRETLARTWRRSCQICAKDAQSSSIYPERRRVTQYRFRVAQTHTVPNSRHTDSHAHRSQVGLLNPNSNVDHRKWKSAP